MIDAHMHFWDVSRYDYPWLRGTSFEKKYLLEDYLSESKRYIFNKAVHIQAGITRQDSVKETAWISHINFPLAIVGYVDLSQDNCESVIEQHCNYPKFTGIRQILNEDTAQYLQDTVWKNNLSLLAKYHLSFDMQIHSEQADDACNVIAKNSNPFIITHCGHPRKLDVSYFEYWKRQMQKLAQFDHVYIKLSGFGMFNPNWSSESIKPFVLSLLEIFGMNRCMFASNFPVDKLYRSLDEIYDDFFKLTHAFSPHEKKQLFGGNAERLYFSRDL